MAFLEICGQDMYIFELAIVSCDYVYLRVKIYLPIRRSCKSVLLDVGGPGGGNDKRLHRSQSSVAEINK